MNLYHFLKTLAYTYIHTHTYTHIHTYTYTHIHTQHVCIANMWQNIAQSKNDGHPHAYCLRMLSSYIAKHCRDFGLLDGGICKHCILFPEQPKRGGSQGAIPGVLVLSVYQSPDNKALGKDGILVCHEKSTMHCHATNQADCFY